MDTGDDPGVTPDTGQESDGVALTREELRAARRERIARRRRRALRDLVITLGLVSIGFPVLHSARAATPQDAGMYVPAGASSMSSPGPGDSSDPAALPSSSITIGTSTGASTGPSTPSPSVSPTPTAPSSTSTPEIPSAPASPRVFGTGTFNVVPLQVAAHGSYPRRTYRLEIEGGLPVDDYALAGAVHRTLVAPQGWQRLAHVNFAQTDTDAYDFRLILASPALVDRLCAPLDTEGAVSCRNGRNVVINIERWLYAVPGYPVATYRQYVINHEVGHFLGHGHEQCPGPGKPAPVMMQQTKGLHGCTPNPWPAVSA